MIPPAPPALPGAVVYAVQEIQKSTLFGGRWGGGRGNVSKRLENRTLLPSVSTLLFGIVVLTRDTITLRLSAF